jgi:hypothetical protein
MADITDPAALNVINFRLRQFADLMGQVHFMAKGIQAEFLAKNWGVLIPDDAAAIVRDGRLELVPISGADCRRVIDQGSALITLNEATSSAKLNQLLKLAVNPTRI